MQAARARHLLVAVALVLLASCAQEPGPASAPAGGDTPAGSAPGPGPVWLAAFRVEADANALDADTQAIMDAAGPAIFTGPVACFQGFPAEHMPTPDAYVLGVIAPTRDEVDAAVERVGRTPIFVGRLTNTCVD